MTKPSKLNLYSIFSLSLIFLSLSLFLNSSSWAISSEIRQPIKLLMDNNTENDSEAIRQLRKTPNSVNLLIQNLKTSQREVRWAILKVIGDIGIDKKAAVDPLINVLQNNNQDEQSRWLAAESLGKIGLVAKKAAGPLIKELKAPDNHQRIRFEAASALSNVAPTEIATIQALIYAFEDKDPYVRSVAAAALGEVLGKIPSQSDLLNKALNDVKEAALKKNTWQVRLAAATALGISGRDVKTAVGILNELLQKYEARRDALQSLGSIGERLPQRASSMSLAERRNAKESLQGIIKDLEKIKDESINSEETIDVDAINRSLANSLEVIIAFQEKTDKNHKLIQFIWGNPKVSIPIIIAALWLAFISILLRLYPLLLLRINDFLQRYTDIPFPEFLGGIKLSTLRLLLLGYHHHPRVLDAWVESHIDTARKEFKKKPTVRERTIHIPVRVALEGKNIAELTAKHLQSSFAEKRDCLLIWGEGGSGKTSLACQIAQWAMSDDVNQRLCKHRMLPIFVEQELDFKVPEGKQAFTELICGILGDLIDAPEPISEELLEQLLRKQRLLVIVDRFSELSKDTRNQIHPELPNFPVNALVITSRLEEKLGGVNKTTLKPMRVEGNRLSSFMEAYLTQLNKRDLFDDKEFFEACSHLSSLASQRDITVLLAKLYAEQMIAAKTSANKDDFPDNIPELILHYLNQLNLSTADNYLDNRTVHHVAKIVAWECLKLTYRPGTAQLEAVLSALGRDNAKTYLDYLENRLHIIQIISPGENQIRFSLDPLAEYLAAWYLVEYYDNDEQLWHAFLKQADDQQGSPATIKDFLLAVRDCYLAKKKERKETNFLLNELDKRTCLEQKLAH